MLIIRSLTDFQGQLDNISTSDDTRNLEKALQDDSNIKDVGHAGTAMRFLTAYLSTRRQKVILTGSPRMKQRPIGPLVEALKLLGAQIEYMEMEGYPPLKISGREMEGGTIEIEGGISSQFISALMMIGPVLHGGLQITLTGQVVSTTYIRMTLELMKQSRVGAIFEGQQIFVPQQNYYLDRFTVESDWSGASYWYQVATLLPGSKIVLPNLSKDSIQGDSILVNLFEKLGVVSDFNKEGVTLNSVPPNLPKQFEYDFTGCPDLVQTCAVTLCALGVHFSFTGTQTLRIKETDRIDALQAELLKLGFVLECDVAGKKLAWDGTRCEAVHDPVIQTYHDHRMAMAFAPLAIPLGRIGIEDPMVVTKSYPGYWNDLRKAGFFYERVP